MRGESPPFTAVIHQMRASTAAVIELLLRVNCQFYIVQAKGTHRQRDA
jgi:hypothetical protein